MKNFLKENLKYLVIILAFALVMIFGTKFAITKWNESHKIVRENVNNNPKCIDLYGTYDANDLKVDQIDYRYKGVELQLVQIQGLKNKKVENAINTEIQSLVNEQIDEGQNAITSYVSGNFSNILSVNIYTSNNSDEYEASNYNSKDFYLNFNLNDGSRIMFTDLFVNDASIAKVVRSAMHETRVTNAFWDELYKIEEESNYLRDDRYDDLHKRPMPIDDDKLTNDVISFMNTPDEEKCFSISSTGIGLFANDGRDYLGTIKYETNAEELAVYDRYVVSPISLFKEKFAPKKIITCAEYTQDYYVEELRGEEASNLYIDFSRSKNFDRSNQYYDDINDENLEAMNKAYNDYIDKEVYGNVIKELKKEASKHKDFYYISFIGLEGQNIRVYQQELIDVLPTIPASNAISCSLTVNTYKVPMNVWKESFHDRLIQTYRSQWFTYSVDKRILTENYDEFEDGKNKEGITFKNTITSKVFDFVRNIEIDDLDKMFDGAITYDDLENEFRDQMHDSWRNLTEEQIENLLKEGVYYELMNDEVRIISATDEDTTAYLYYSEIDLPLFSIYSDDVKDLFYEITGTSKEELTDEINEIEEVNENEIIEDELEVQDENEIEVKEN